LVLPPIDTDPCGGGGVVDKGGEGERDEEEGEVEVEVEKDKDVI
jgi:hypothetical protein